MVKGFHLKGILEEYSKDVGQDIATLLLYWFFPHFAISFPFFVYPQTDTFFSFFLLLLVLTLQNDGPIPSCDELLVDRYRKTCFTESFKRKAWRSIYIVKDKVAFWEIKLSVGDEIGVMGLQLGRLIDLFYGVFHRALNYL